VETLIALVLSSIIIALVSHTFLVQNRFYATQTLRTGAQDNVRAATELIAREIRSTAEAGVIVAGRRTLTIRSPMMVVVICNRVGPGGADVMIESASTPDTAEVAGLALRSGTSWDYQNAPWSTLSLTSSTAAADCYANGADTIGARNDFYRVSNLNSIFSTVPAEGDVVMAFRETTFSIAPSQLDSTTFAIYRTVYGGSPIEFATGIDTTSQFQYRTGGATYADTIPTAMANIDVVRIVAVARKAAPTGGVDDITFGWSVNVPMRNVR
jgi:Tfp pilus assembly protein PilW